MDVNSQFDQEPQLEFIQTPKPKKTIFQTIVSITTAFAMLSEWFASFGTIYKKHYPNA